jgi:MYXO-CTERM domain-containing protein
MGGPGLAESPPMLRRATLLLCLLPGAALAQTTAGTCSALVTTQSATGVANRTDCASTSTNSTWTLTSGVTPVVANGDRWRLAVFSGSCDTANVPSAGGSASVFQDVTATGATQVITLVPVATMATRSGVSSCTQASDVTVAICVYYIPGTGSTTAAQLAAQGSFVFQMAIPPRPVIGKVTPGDTQLTVSVGPGSTTATETATTSITYTATCTPPPGSGLPTQTSAAGNAGNLLCGGLTNSTAYTVNTQGFSQAGNAGFFSASAGPDASTTPLPFLNFWQVYKSDGGVETGGCSTGGSGALVPALALLGLLAVRRRRS